MLKALFKIRCLIGEPEEEDSVCGRLNELRDFLIAANPET